MIAENVIITDFPINAHWRIGGYEALQFLIKNWLRPDKSDAIGREHHGIGCSSWVIGWHIVKTNGESVNLRNFQGWSLASIFEFQFEEKIIGVSDGVFKTHLKRSNPSSFIKNPASLHFFELCFGSTLPGLKFAFHRFAFAVENIQFLLIDNAIIKQSSEAENFDDENGNLDPVRFGLVDGICLAVGMAAISWGWWNIGWRPRYHAFSLWRFIAGFAVLAIGLIFLHRAFWHLI